MDNYGFAAASRIKNGTFRSLKDKRNIKHKFSIIRRGSVTGVHVNAEDVDEDEDCPDLVNSSDDESSKGGAREQFSSFRSPVNRGVKRTMSAPAVSKTREGHKSRLQRSESAPGPNMIDLNSITPEELTELLAMAKPKPTVDNFDKSIWSMEGIPPTDGQVPMINLRNIPLDMEWTIPQARLNHALKILDGASITDALSSPCCSKNCHLTCTPRMVIECRGQCLEFLSKDTALKFLGDTLRARNASISSPTKRGVSGIKYHLIDAKKTKCCASLFYKVMHVDSSYARGKITKYFRTGATGVPDSAIPKARDKQKTAHDIAWAFWNDFFKQCCQKPNEWTRLFPVNRPMLQIYNHEFLPWVKRHPMYAEAAPASYNYWRTVRHDKAFRDVVKRPTHRHCQCYTCDIIKKMQRKGFRNEAESSEFALLVKTHQDAIKRQRRMEAEETSKADHSPHLQVTIKVDDTTAIGFPVLTKRPFKSMPTGKFYVIPMLCDFEAKKYYILMPKNKWKKGANRLATTLHRLLRAIKNNPDHPHFRARRLVMLCDNYSENQNNTMIKFWCDVVAHDWFDIICIHFGLVGHSHNGADAPHAVLNNMVLNLVSPTLVQLVPNSKTVWKTPRTTPEFVVLDAVNDWETHYKNRANINLGVTLSGFTNTPGDPATVRGWKIEKENGVVSVRWKQDPTDPNEPWRGTDSTGESPGYVVLKQVPQGVPAVIEPAKDITTPEYYKEFGGVRMSMVLGQHYRYPGAVEWLLDAAKDGVFPIAKWLDDEEKPSTVGRLAQMVCDNDTTEVRMMTALDPTMFWPSAEQGAALPLRRHCQTALDSLHGVPNVRVAGTKPNQAPGYNQSTIGQQASLLGEHNPGKTKASHQKSGTGSVEDYTISELCVKDSFAIVHQVYTDDTKSSGDTNKRKTPDKEKSGIVLVKITKSLADQQFDAVPYNYYKNSSLPWQSSILLCQWGAPNRKTKPQAYDHGDVLAYFKTPNQGNKIPSKYSQWILDTYNAKDIFDEVQNDDDSSSGNESPQQDYSSQSDAEAPCDK